MLKRVISAIVLILMCAVLIGTALADYGYTSTDRIPMAYPFTVKVAFDGDGLPHIATNYPFEKAGADEMNLAYVDETGNQVFTMNYNRHTGKTSVGSYDGNLFDDVPGQQAFRMIREGKYTLDDEITINTAHFNTTTDWILVYSTREGNYVSYSEADHAQTFNGMGAGGTNRSIYYENGVMYGGRTLRRNEDADLIVEYNAYGEIQYASVIQYGDEFVYYDYDPDTGLFSGRPITELGFKESDLAIEALAARSTSTEVVARDYETQIVSDSKNMVKDTVRISGGIVTGIIMGIVLYYMLRRGRQNVKEKAAVKKENAEKAAEKAEEAPEIIEPPQMMSSSNG